MLILLCVKYISTMYWLIPLASLISSPLNFTINTENNEDNNQDESENEFDNNTESVYSQEVTGVSSKEEIAVVSSECDTIRSAKALYTHPQSPWRLWLAQEFTGVHRRSQEFAGEEFEEGNGSCKHIRLTNAMQHDWPRLPNSTYRALNKIKTTRWGWEEPSQPQTIVYRFLRCL